MPSKYVAHAQFILIWKSRNTRKNNQRRKLESICTNTKQNVTSETESFFVVVIVMSWFVVKLSWLSTTVPYLSVYSFICLSSHLSINLSILLFVCLSSVFLSVFPSARWHTFLDAFVWNGFNIASNLGFPAASDGGGQGCVTPQVFVGFQRSYLSLCNSQGENVGYLWRMSWYWSKHSRIVYYEV